MNETNLETMAAERFDLRATSPPRHLASGNVKRGAIVETAESTFVLQELNTDIYPDPDALMGNTIAICQRVRELNLPAQRFVPTVDGSWVAHLDGVPWRCYEYVAGQTDAAITSPEAAQATARAFGRFAEAIADLKLIEHLPGYHDFDARVAALEDATRNDELGLVASCSDVLDDVLRVVDRLRLSPSYEAWSERMVRNSHNDAKAPNCVRARTGARTVIDLDTTMPGSILADVGELVRSSTRALGEVSPSTMMGQIEAVNRGFLAGYRLELTDGEKFAMLVAGPLMTAENAVRFLTDHLSGDKYYGATEPNQNLHRAVVQLRLAQAQIGAIEHAVSG